MPSRSARPQRATQSTCRWPREVPRSLQRAGGLVSAVLRWGAVSVTAQDLCHASCPPPPTSAVSRYRGRLCSLQAKEELQSPLLPAFTPGCSRWRAQAWLQVALVLDACCPLRWTWPPQQGRLGHSLPLSPGLSCR